VSSRKHFIWGFIAFTVLMVAGLALAIWLVFRLA
jgi:hypothetical protein